MNFSIKNFFSKCDQICSFLADLVTFTEEILNAKLHFLCRVNWKACFFNLQDIALQLHDYRLEIGWIFTQNLSRSFASTNKWWYGGQTRIDWCRYGCFIWIGKGINNGQLSLSDLSNWGIKVIKLVEVY